MMRQFSIGSTVGQRRYLVDDVHDVCKHTSVVVYGEPMLDVQFISASNDTRCSSGAANIELAIIEVSTPTH